MKTSVIEVRDMLSVLGALGLEKRIGAVPGVESVTVNYAAGSATVRYDETRLGVADIKSSMRQGRYDAAAPVAALTGEVHEGHMAPGAPPRTSASAAPKSATDAAADKAAAPSKRVAALRQVLPRRRQRLRSPRPRQIQDRARNLASPERRLPARPATGAMTSTRATPPRCSGTGSGSRWLSPFRWLVGPHPGTPRL